MAGSTSQRSMLVANEQTCCDLPAPLQPAPVNEIDMTTTRKTKLEQLHSVSLPSDRTSCLTSIHRATCPVGMALLACGIVIKCGEYM
jgi:hypothetical protein